VIHDDTVTRTAQGTLKTGEYVHQLTLKELQSLDVGQGEVIPSLTQALQWVKRNPTLLGFVIEIKTCPKDSRKIVEPVLEAILAEKMTEKCMVISFDHLLVGECKHLCKQVATGLLYAKPEELKADIFDLCLQHQADSIWPAVSAVTQELVTFAHQKNLAVFTWVANTEKIMRKAIAAGVDGIGSDVPDRLKALS
jgi:glycerophosphoryl diester phosphodiesterase